MELLHEVVPSATQVALLVNPTSPILTEWTSRARLWRLAHLACKLHVLHASSDLDFDAVFAALPQLRAGALVIGPDAFFDQPWQPARRTGAPYRGARDLSISPVRRGGRTYELRQQYQRLYRWVGIYTGRVLRGEKPSEVPVQQITKVELIINLKTAKALGLTVPLPLLGRADEVIE